MIKIKNTFLILGKVCKYIFQNNKPWRVPIVFFNAIIFHWNVTFKKRIISKRLFNHKKIFLFPENSISSFFVYNEVPDKIEIDWLRNLADKKTVFLDIGANIGSYSILLTDKVKKLYAFEPSPYPANCCRLNFLLNNIPLSSLMEVALSDRSGQAHLTNFDGISTENHLIKKGNKNSIPVASSTLDDFASKKLSKKENILLKIDVEGFEETVLKGGEKFLQDYNIKGIIIECFGGYNSMPVKILKKYGYKVFKLSWNNYCATKK